MPVFYKNLVQDPLDVDKRKTIRNYRKEADPHGELTSETDKESSVHLFKERKEVETIAGDLQSLHSGNIHHLIGGTAGAKQLAKAATLSITTPSQQMADMPDQEGPIEQAEDESVIEDGSRQQTGSFGARDLPADAINNTYDETILTQALTDGVHLKQRAATQKGLGVYAQQFTVNEKPQPKRKLSVLVEEQEPEPSEFAGMSLNQLKHALDQQTKMTELQVKKLAYQSAFGKQQPQAAQSMSRNEASPNLKPEMPSIPTVNEEISSHPSVSSRQQEEQKEEKNEESKQPSKRTESQQQVDLSWFEKQEAVLKNQLLQLQTQKAQAQGQTNVQMQSFDTRRPSKMNTTTQGFGLTTGPIRARKLSEHSEHSLGYKSQLTYAGGLRSAFGTSSGMQRTGGVQKLGGMAFRKYARQSSKHMLEFQKTVLSDSGQNLFDDNNLRMGVELTNETPLYKNSPTPPDLGKAATPSNPIAEDQGENMSSEHNAQVKNYDIQLHQIQKQLELIVADIQDTKAVIRQQKDEPLKDQEIAGVTEIKNLNQDKISSHKAASAVLSKQNSFKSRSKSVNTQLDGPAEITGVIQTQTDPTGDLPQNVNITSFGAQVYTNLKVNRLQSEIPSNFYQQSERPVERRSQASTFKQAKTVAHITDQNSPKQNSPTFANNNSPDRTQRVYRSGTQVAFKIPNESPKGRKSHAQSPSALKNSIEELQVTAQRMKTQALNSLATVELRKSATIRESQKFKRSSTVINSAVKREYENKYAALQKSYEMKQQQIMSNLAQIHALEEQLKIANQQQQQQILQKQQKQEIESIHEKERTLGQQSFEKPGLQRISQPQNQMDKNEGIAIQTSSKTLPKMDELSIRSHELSKHSDPNIPQKGKSDAFQQLTHGDTRVEDPRNSLNPNLVHHSRQDDTVLLRSVLAPVTLKDASCEPKTADIGLDARVRDMATEPRYNEKGNDPKMRDTACDAWKRDGFAQTSKTNHKGQGHFVNSDKIIIPTKYKVIEEELKTEKKEQAKVKEQRKKAPSPVKMVDQAGTQYHIGARSTELSGHKKNTDPETTEDKVTIKSYKQSKKSHSKTRNSPEISNQKNSQRVDVSHDRKSDALVSGEKDRRAAKKRSSLQDDIRSEQRPKGQNQVELTELRDSLQSQRKAASKPVSQHESRPDAIPIYHDHLAEEIIEQKIVFRQQEQEKSNENRARNDSRSTQHLFENQFHSGKVKKKRNHIYQQQHTQALPPLQHQQAMQYQQQNQHYGQHPHHQDYRMRHERDNGSSNNFVQRTNSLPPVLKGYQQPPQNNQNLIGSTYQHQMTMPIDYQLHNQLINSGMPLQKMQTLPSKSQNSSGSPQPINSQPSQKSRLPAINQGPVINANDLVGPQVSADNAPNSVFPESLAANTMNQSLDFDSPPVNFGMHHKMNIQSGPDTIGTMSPNINTVPSNLNSASQKVRREQSNFLQTFKGQELESYYMEKALKPEVEKEIKKGFFEIKKKFDGDSKGRQEEVQVYVSHVSLHNFHPIFSKMNLETVKQILQFGSIVYLNKGQTLYAPGFNDHIFYIILFGRFKLSKAPQGPNEKPEGFGQPLNIGWTAGEEILFKPEKNHEGKVVRKEVCHAMKDSCVLGIEKKNLIQIKKILYERNAQEEFSKFEIVLRGNHLVKADWK